MSLIIKVWLFKILLKPIHPTQLDSCIPPTSRKRSKKMENESETETWTFRMNEKPMNTGSAITIQGTLKKLMENLNKDDRRPTVPLGLGDPSAFPCFRTTAIAEDAIVDAVRSAKYNCYAPSVGILPARRAIADYLSGDLPYALSPDDVYLTIGCKQAIEIVLTVLARRPGANILLPRPGYPRYEGYAASKHLKVRNFDLNPENGWEVDLHSVEALADENTVAMVILNPGNPCGTVYTYQHLNKIAETARKLGILVIADEVYHHLTFGSNPFVPMGAFGSAVPILTLGSISKRWIVPGWRLGWLVINDPNGILKKSGVVECITDCFDIVPNPPTLIQRSRLIILAQIYRFHCLHQGAVHHILGKTGQDFFSKVINTLREAADISFDRIKEIPCITCPHKPEGSMFLMVKLNLSLLEDINDDMEFCLKLAKEESVIVLPGAALGMKNWLRITYAIEPSTVEEGFRRIQAFCERHAKKQ